jgi:hypothetical protein
MEYLETLLAPTHAKGFAKIQFPIQQVDYQNRLSNALDLSYLELLSDQVGIMQHAVYSTPDYRHGYSLDDQSRALMLVVVANELNPHPRYVKLIHTYLAYIQYMKTEHGSFRNFLSYDRRFIDEHGTDDSLGRTVHALGFCYLHNSDPRFEPIILELYRFCLQTTRRLRSVRSICYSLLGILYFLDKDPQHQESKEIVEELTLFLKEEYHQASTRNWHWFEEIISYENAVLPLAMLRAARFLNEPSLRTIGLDSADFLLENSFEATVFVPIGNEKWWKKGEDKSEFGQQPVEVPSMLLLLEELYFHSQDNIHLQQMVYSFQWFLGLNTLGTALFDPITKGCKDGLERHGVNGNQGAESVISFWMSYVYMFTRFN